MKYKCQLKIIIIGLVLIGHAFSMSAQLQGLPQLESKCNLDSVAMFDFSAVSYSPDDSVEIVSLLRENYHGNDVIYYARRMLGRPYVAHTLEVADSEKLVVNLQGLDCTTLVETVCALSLTKRQCSDKFADYCRNLEKLRYFSGHRNGYCSRLHYFTWWIKDNMERDLIEEVSDSDYFVCPMNVQNAYMSKFPHRYKFLKNRKERIKIIQELEKRYNGTDGKYLPKYKTSLSQSQLSFIHDGDIIAIVTNKEGLDYSHLGFALWGRDGRLHLLNASLSRGKVIEDNLTLEEYLNKYSHMQGVRVLRLK